jgi:DNA repair exonuclease SbcCD nuclease subunit
MPEHQSVTFLHTADWQLGKPFASVDDVQKRSLIQQERFSVLQRIGDLAREQNAQFIVIAGDLFDSSSATRSTVSSACSAIGAMEIPVVVIPGNHDHGGPGCIWEQEFFKQEREALAPNLQVLLKPEPVEICGVVLLPCPLLRRHEAADPASWLHSCPDEFAGFGNKPRLALIHGSVQGFANMDEEAGGQANLVNLSRLPDSDLDYIALGDWHGMKQVGPKAWYSGTPEIDRFPKGGSNDPGHTLVVEIQRGTNPKVTPVQTARLGWHQLSFTFADEDGLTQLDTELNQLIGNRASTDLLQLELDGSLGIDATTCLEQKLNAWEARLLRLKLTNRTTVAPSEEEIDALTKRSGDPLISRVAGELVSRLATGGDDAELARIALRELHALCRS